MTKLKDKQELFCLEYLVDLNGAQAAIRAGYSEHTARQIASELLTKPDIENRLQQLMEERTKSVQIEVDDVLRDILETRKEAALDKRYSERLKANELLGKYKKMWVDKVETQPLDKNGQPTDSINLTVTMVKSES
jgi:phage terminase small subunit